MKVEHGTYNGSPYYRVVNNDKFKSKAPKVKVILSRKQNRKGLSSEQLVNRRSTYHKVGQRYVESFFNKDAEAA